MRVLVVEDEARLARQLADALGGAGYAVDAAGDGARADFLARTETYDAVVLDLGLPGVDGLTVLRGWRQAGLQLPVLVLTARGSWHEKVQGIDGGADDYVAKPFQIEEVLARVRGLIRRSSGHGAPDLHCGALMVDPRGARVTVGGKPVKLTSHEFRVLSYLMHHRDRVVSQSELTEHIYARDADRDSNTVEVFVARLRRKLGAGFIETVRGLGYRMQEPAGVWTPALMAALTLRARLLIGAILWTIGLFAVAGVIVTQLMASYPEAPRYFHLPFTHAPMSISLAALCMIVGFLQVRRGLSAVAQVRERLADVHAGRERRLLGEYPGEMQPLVSDLNALLAARDESVARAQAKAGDLAHGLKTPLAVLAHEADRAETAKLADLALAIRHEVERMRRQIDYHLAHARAAASGPSLGSRASVATAVDGLVRTLVRLHADRGVCIEATIDPGHTIRGQDQDLEEMLGNLLDNACKWARTRVVVHSEAGTADIAITVDDDGPGLAPAMREAVLRRGVRADENDAAPGSGLGLAIVRDLAALYGGSIELSASPLRGLRATLTLKR